MLAQAANLTLRILETTDLHRNLISDDDDQDRLTTDDGLAFTAPLVRAARAEAGNSLLFDNDDLMPHGSRPLQRAPFIRPARCFRQTARRLVPQVRAADSDLIILILHLGFERGATPRRAENAVARLARQLQVRLVKDNGNSSATFERLDRPGSARRVSSLSRHPTTARPRVPAPGRWR